MWASTLVYSPWSKSAYIWPKSRPTFTTLAAHHVFDVLSTRPPFRVHAPTIVGHSCHTPPASPRTPTSCCWSGEAPKRPLHFPPLPPRSPLLCARAGMVNVTMDVTEQSSHHCFSPLRAFSILAGIAISFPVTCCLLSADFVVTWPPAARVAGAATAAGRCLRGRLATGHRGANQGHQQVRKHLLMLRRHLVAAGELPNRQNREPSASSVQESWQGPRVWIWKKGGA
jgi:hypothetical protein